MTNREELKEFWSPASDGTFAVALAILELADETSRVAAALRLLGTADAATPMGAIEALAVEVKGVADAIGAGLESLTNAT